VIITAAVLGALAAALHVLGMPEQRGVTVSFLTDHERQETTY